MDWLSFSRSREKVPKADEGAFPAVEKVEKPSLTPALSRKRERGLERD